MVNIDEIRMVAHSGIGMVNTLSFLLYFQAHLLIITVPFIIIIGIPNHVIATIEITDATPMVHPLIAIVPKNTIRRCNLWGKHLPNQKNNMAQCKAENVPAPIVANKQLQKPPVNENMAVIIQALDMPIKTAILWLLNIVLIILLAQKRINHPLLKPPQKEPPVFFPAVHDVLIPVLDEVNNMPKLYSLSNLAQTTPLSSI
jgi:hypothetical protein